MAQNDFFVSFGSNAKEFGAALIRDLKPVRAEIAEIQALLGQVSTRGGAVGTAAQSRLAGRTPAKEEGGGGGGRGAKADSQVDIGGGALKDINDFALSVAKARDEFVRMMGTLGTLVQRIDQTSEAYKREESRQNHSTGQLNRTDNQLRGPDGHPLHRGATQGVSFLNRGSASVLPHSSSSTPLSFSSTPAAAISDAAVSRIVTAIEAGNSETKAVRKAIEKLPTTTTTTTTPAGAPRAPETNRQAERQANSERATVEALIAKRERLNALHKEGSRLESGGPVDPRVATTALGGSKKFAALAEKTGFSGDEYATRVHKAIDSLTNELAGTPTLRKLRSQLAALGDAVVQAAPKAPTAPKAAPAAKEPPSPEHQGMATRLAQIDSIMATVKESAKDDGGVSPAVQKMIDGLTAEADGLRSKVNAAEAAASPATPAADGAKPPRESKHVRELNGRIAQANELIQTMTVEPPKEVTDGLAALIAERDRLVSTTRAERTTENKLIAATEKVATERAQGGKKSRERAAVQADLDAPADPASFKDSVRKGVYRKEDLQRIAGNYADQGYGEQLGKLNSKTTNAGYTDAILNARKAYDESGGVTRTDLTTSSKTIAASVGPQVRDMIKPVVEAATATAQEAAALRTRSLDRLTGGQDTRRTDSLGRERVQRGAIQRGGAFGGDLNKYVDKAEAILAERGERVSRANINSALQQSGQLKPFNPYDPALKEQIKGAGPEVDDAKRALSGLRRASNAIDEMAKEALKVKDALTEQQASLEGLKKGSSAYRAVQARITRLQESLAGKEALVTPNFEAGYKLRAQARPEYQAQALVASQAAKESQENRRAVEGGAADALAGARAFNGSKNDITRNLPGLTVDRKNQFAFNGDNRERASTDLTDINRARSSINSVLLKLATETDADTLAKLNRKLENSGQKLLNAYEKLAVGVSSVSLEQLIGRKPGADAAAADATRRVRTAETVLNDPENMARQAAKAEKKAQRAATAGGGGGGEPPTGTSGGRRSGGEGAENATLTKILARLNGIHETLKGELKLAPRTGGGRPREAKAELEDGSSAAPRRATKREPISTNSPKGRENFRGQLPQDLLALVAGEDKVAAAAELVRRGFANQSQALGYFRGELKQTTAEAKDFEAAMKANLGDSALSGRAQVGNTRDRKKKAKDENEYGRQYDEAHTLNARLDRQQTGSATAAQAKLRQQARDAQALKSALKELSEATKLEITDLAALTKAGTDQVAVAEKQVQVYASLSRELRARPGGATAAEVKGVARTVISSTGVTPSSGEMNDIARQAKSTGGFKAVDESFATEASAAGGIFGQESKFTKAFFGGTGFWSRVLGSTGTFFVRDFTAGFVFSVTNALKDVVKEAILTEATFVRVSTSLQATGRSTGNLRTQLGEISSQYGTSLQEVYKVASQLTGLFKSTDDIAGATRIVAQLESISEGALSAKEGVGALASIMAGFPALANQAGLDHVADVFTVIQDRLSVNIEVTAQGVAHISGQVRRMGLSFEQAAVYVAEISKKTNQDGAASGDQFSRIAEAMGTARGREVLLKDIGPETGVGTALQTHQYGAVFDILMEKYAGLSKAKQDDIAITLGGARQQAAINALFADGAQAIDTISAATYANGQAQQRLNDISNQLNQQMDRFKQNLIGIGSNVLRSGLLVFFELLLGVANKLLGVIDSIASTLNGFADSNGFLSFIRSAVGGLTGLAIAMTLIRKSLGGFRATLNSIPLVGGNARTARSEAAGAAAAAAGEAGAAAPRSIRERISGGVAGTRSVLAAEEEVAFSRTTNRFGRALESITTGPMRRFGAGAESFGATLQAAAGAEGAARPRTAGRLGRAFGAIGRGTNRFAGALEPGIQGFPTEPFIGPLQEGFIGPLPAARPNLLGRLGASLTDRGSTNLGEEASRGARAADVAFRGAGSAATLAGKAVTGVSGAFSKMAESALATQVALTVAIVGIGLFIGQIISDITAANNGNAARKAAFPTAQEGRDKIAASNNANFEGTLKTDAKQKHQDATNFSFGNTLKYTTRGIEDFFTTPKFFEGHEMDRIYKGMTGDLPDDVKKNLDDKSKSIQLGLLGHKGQSAGDISKAQSDALDQLRVLADEVGSNGDLSTEQKDAAAGMLQQVQHDLGEQAQTLILISEGLNGASHYTTDQLKMIDSNAQSFAGLRKDVGTQYAPQIKALNSLGLQDGNNVSPLLDKLGGGGLGLVDAAQTNQALAKNELDSANAKVQSLQDPRLGGADPDQLKAAQQDVRTKLKAYNDSFATLLDAALKSYADTAAVLGNKGDYAAQEHEIDRGIAALQSEIANTSDDDARNALIIKLKDLGSQAIAASVAQLTNQTVVAKSTNPGALFGAQQDAALARAKQQSTTSQYFSTPGSVTQQELAAAEAAANSADTNVNAQKQALHTANYNSQAAATVNDLTKAQIQAAASLDALNYAEKTYGIGSIEYANAATGRTQALQAETAAQNAQAAAVRQTQLTQIAPGNTQAVAAKTLSNATAALRDAKAAGFGPGTAQYQSAVDGMITAVRGVGDAAATIAKANASLTTAYATAAGDTVSAAYASVNTARLTLSDAYRKSGGARSADVINAEAGLVSAQAGVNTAIQGVADAQSAVAIALATKGGYVVDVARLTLENAQRKLAAELKKSGGKTDTPGVLNAQAAVINAEAGQRDTILQDKLDTIDFNQQTRRITANAAISALTDILKQTDLTRKERRDVQLKLFGLQNDLRQLLTGGGFNIPTAIKLPTAYEIRRSLGIDSAQKQVQAAFTDLQAMQKTMAGATAGAAASAGSSRLGSNSDGHLVSAMNSVRDAVSSNGAQVVNNVDITNQVAQPAMVAQVAKAVVDLINSQSAASARSNTGATKLFSY